MALNELDHIGKLILYKNYYKKKKHTSPFSSGTIREYSVVQMTSSSELILSMVL